jgi:AcrR family transcriptional regulator
MTAPARNGRPVRTPSQERALDKKNRIIRAAYELFDLHGFEEVSIRGIAREAGVSIGTIYSYFHDKSDLFVAARKLYRDELYENFLEVIEHELDGAVSLEEALLAVIRCLDGVMGRRLTFYREMMIMVLRDEGLKQGFIIDEGDNGRAVAELFMKKFHSRLMIRDRELTAFVLHRIVREVVQFMLLFPTDMPRDRVYEELARIMAGYLQTT